MHSVPEIPRSCSGSETSPACFSRLPFALSTAGSHARSARMLSMQALGVLTLAFMAGCASAPPAPIESRTMPAGGHLSASIPDRPAAPVVPARPSSGAPVQAARPATAASGGSSSVGASGSAQPARPGAATSSPRPVPSASATPPSTPPPATGAQVQTQALAVPALESRALESRPLEPPAPPQSTAPVTATAADRAVLDFAWPVPGRVLQPYSETGKGITLSGNAGDPVFAAAEGRVIFSGNGPRGYGNLIIVKHPNDLLSVYAHNRKLLVKEGQNVARGERIAELGDTGGASPRLHFEIRRQGKPVDPIPFLPRR